MVPGRPGTGFAFSTQRGSLHDEDAVLLMSLDYRPGESLFFANSPLYQILNLVAP